MKLLQEKITQSEYFKKNENTIKDILGFLNEKYDVEIDRNISNDRRFEFQLDELNDFKEMKTFVKEFNKYLNAFDIPSNIEVYCSCDQDLMVGGTIEFRRI